MSISNSAMCPADRKAKPAEVSKAAMPRKAKKMSLLTAWRRARAQDAIHQPQADVDPVHPNTVHHHDPEPEPAAWVSSRMRLTDEQRIASRAVLHGRMDRPAVEVDRAMPHDKVEESLALLQSIATSTGKTLKEVLDLIGFGEETDGEWGGVVGGEDFDSEWGPLVDLQKARTIYLSSFTTKPTLGPSLDCRECAHLVHGGGSGGIFQQLEIAHIRGDHTGAPVKPPTYNPTKNPLAIADRPDYVQYMHEHPDDHLDFLHYIHYHLHYPDHMDWAPEADAANPNNGHEGH